MRVCKNIPNFIIGFVLKICIRRKSSGRKRVSGEVRKQETFSMYLFPFRLFPLDFLHKHFARAQGNRQRLTRPYGCVDVFVI